MTRSFLKNEEACSWTPIRSLIASRFRTGSKPSTDTRPWSACLRPSITSIRVVFPAPFRPSKPKTSPFRTSRWTSFRATTFSYRFETPQTLIAIWLASIGTPLLSQEQGRHPEPIREWNQRIQLDQDYLDGQKAHANCGRLPYRCCRRTNPPDHGQQAQQHGVKRGATEQHCHYPAAGRF